MSEKPSRINILLDLTREIKKLPLDEALHTITDAAMLLLPGEHASVRVLDDRGTDLLCGARSGEGIESRPLSFKKGEGVIGWVVENEETALIHDTDKDDRFRKGGPLNIRSILAVPLWSASQVLGVLGITSSKPNAFSEKDETMATLLANSAVPPIEKARIQRLAVTDRETMAYSQRYLLPRLREETRRAARYVAPVSVLTLHLDRLEEFEEKEGKEAGGRILRGFADRLRASVRRTDILVRKGGRFVLISPYTGSEDAFELGSRIRLDMAECKLFCGGGIDEIQPVSVGVAMWNTKEDPEELSARSEAAAVKAIENGGNRVESAD